MPDEWSGTMPHIGSKNERAYLTPPDVAKLLRVSPEKVLEAFLAARAVHPPAKRPQRKRQSPDGGPIDPVLGKALLKKGQAVVVGKVYYGVWNGTILFF
jgi:hypothetical protein